MTSDLNNYIKSNSKHLKIEDGETVQMVYKGFSIIPDRFNPGKETVSYLLAYPDTGKTTSWNKSSTKVASQMNQIQAGETISITRFGEGTETSYKIKVVGHKPLGNVKETEPDETPF